MRRLAVALFALCCVAHPSESRAQQTHFSIDAAVGLSSFEGEPFLETGQFAGAIALSWTAPVDVEHVTAIVHLGFENYSGFATRVCASAGDSGAGSCVHAPNLYGPTLTAGLQWTPGRVSVSPFGGVAWYSVAHRDASARASIVGVDAALQFWTDVAVTGRWQRVDLPDVEGRHLRTHPLLIGLRLLL